MQTKMKMKMVFPLRCEAMSGMLNELLLGVPLYPDGPVITTATSEDEILSCAMDACDGYKRLPITSEEVILFRKIDDYRWHGGVCTIEPWVHRKYGYTYEEFLLIECIVEIGFKRKDSAYWMGMLKWKPDPNHCIY